MARRVEDMTREAGGFQPSADMEARMLEEVAAWKRGELPVVTLEELQPLLTGWIAECEELAAAREAAGIPEGQHWEPPGGFRDWGAEMAALPWRTRKEREQDGEQW